MQTISGNFLVLALASVCALDAAVINDNPIFGSYTAGSFSPIGQTFHAIDAAIGLAGFEISIANPNQPAPPPITYNLYAGTGINGALIASRTIQGPPDPFPMTPRFLTADFSGTILNPGAVYTLSALDPTEYWGISFTLDSYSGGTAMLCGSVAIGCNLSPFEPSLIDLKFEVLEAAPEPGTFYTTVALGCLVMGSRIGRRRRAVRNQQMRLLK